ncbi:universal stress protein [Caldiplasma sukawensis]
MRIVLAYDNSPSAQEALAFVKKMKNSIDSLRIIYVYQSLQNVVSAMDTAIPQPAITGEIDFGKKVKESVGKLMSEVDFEWKFEEIESRGESVAQTIYSTAKNDSADLIVTGTRKLGGLSKFILGSVSSELIKISTIPVTVVSAKEEEKSSEKSEK